MSRRQRKGSNNDNDESSESDLGNTNRNEDHVVGEADADDDEELEELPDEAVLGNANDDDEEEYDNLDDFDDGEDEEEDDDIDTFNGDGHAAVPTTTTRSRPTAGSSSIGNQVGTGAVNALVQQRLRQLNAARAAFNFRTLGARDGSDEEAEDSDNEDDEGDDDDQGGSAGSGPYASALRELLRSALGRGFTGGAPRGFGSSSSSSSSPASTANLISGGAFVDAMAFKKRQLLEHCSDELLGPIAASGRFLMRPNPAHAPTQSQLRLHADGVTASAASFTSPLTTFWNEFEDTLDDAVLALAKHELKADREDDERRKQKQRNNSNNKGKKKVIEERSPDHALTESAGVVDEKHQEEIAASSSPQHNSSSSPPRTPRHAESATSTSNDKNHQRTDSISVTPTVRLENAHDVPPASSSSSSFMTSSQRQYTEADYSPWAGPSPANREREQEQRDASDRNGYDTFSSPTAATGTVIAEKRSISRTVPSSLSSASSAPSSLISDCISFLRTPPPFLPSTHRGSISGCHVMQPISGFALSSAEAVPYNDSVLFAIGSRSGTFALGAFQPSHWKSMMVAASNRLAERRQHEQQPFGDGDHQHRNSFSSNNINYNNNNNNNNNTNISDNSHEESDDFDDPEFASMGRFRTTSSIGSHHQSNASSSVSALLSFPLQHVETIRRSGPPLFDTAWHPTIPLYAAVGGLPEMILGFAGDVLKKIGQPEGGRNGRDSAADAAPPSSSLTTADDGDDDDDEENDLIMSKNILPCVGGNNNNNNNSAHTSSKKSKRARTLIVDVNNADAMRSYVYGVDFFGHHSVVCGCSGGAVSTIAIRPDGQFVVNPLTIHTDDVNAVARFGRDPESNLFVTGADDRRVSLCDSRVADGHVAFGSGHTLGIMSVTARKDDYFFASVGKDQVVKLWDVRKLSAPMTSMGMRRGDLARRERDDDRFALRWNHYNPPSTAPIPMQTRGDQSSLSMPNASRSVYTLVRAKFSPFQSTGGRYLLVGGCGGSQIFDIVAGGVVANLVWDDVGSADEVMRDVAWIDDNCVVACTQTAAHVFAGF